MLFDKLTFIHLLDIFDTLCLTPISNMFAQSGLYSIQQRKEYQIGQLTAKRSQNIPIKKHYKKEKKSQKTI